MGGLLVSSVQAAQSTAPSELRVVVPETGLAAVGEPRVFVRVFQNGQPRLGTPASPVLQRWQTALGSWTDLNLVELEGPQTWFTALLDTGAAGHLITLATAQRFGIVALPGITGISQGHFGVMESAVSYPYGLALAGSRGYLGEAPVDEFRPVQNAAQFYVDVRARNPAQLIQLGGINLIGMPAMRQYLFELDPSAMSPGSREFKMPATAEERRALHTRVAGPSVRILASGTMPKEGVLRLPLRYVDRGFVSRTLAGARSPVMAESPVLIGVRSWANGRWFVGNWMLDTGAAMSFVSRRQALALGWTPQAPESLSATNLTVQDVTGAQRWRMAMRLDKLEMRNPQNQILEFQNATVLIQDVSSLQPDGSQFALDGVIGNNLLLPSRRSAPDAEAGEYVKAPFKRVFIDGYRAELGFEPHTWPTNTALAQP